MLVMFLQNAYHAFNSMVPLNVYNGIIINIHKTSLALVCTKNNIFISPGVPVGCNLSCPSLVTLNKCMYLYICIILILIDLVMVKYRFNLVRNQTAKTLPCL